MAVPYNIKIRDKKVKELLDDPIIGRQLVKDVLTGNKWGVNKGQKTVTVELSGGKSVIVKELGVGTKK